MGNHHGFKINNTCVFTVISDNFRKPLTALETCNC